ncbi:hypothetical protein [Flexibacterium corallicola]|uniref:hypothetical protein n=1 Tax=Flexibacterium corallicola TaxID=3037259 RepID=UPI00286EC736|nr:hypothetical protein [Pseudovibrio sp. M1P-2-3]
MLDDIDATYRDYIVAGLPESGEHNPEKAEIRAVLKKIRDNSNLALKKLTQDVERALSTAEGFPGYATKAELIAVDSPKHNQLGQVTNDPDPQQNGLYRWDSLLEDWVKSNYDRYSLVVDDLAEKTADLQPKLETPILTTGQLFNGAEYWTGEEVGAGFDTGGWRIPAGQTGATTFLKYQFKITEAQAQSLAGQTARFVVTLRTTANFLQKFVSLSVGSNSPEGEYFNFQYNHTDTETVVLKFDYRFSGQETFVDAFLQVPAESVVQSEDVWCVVRKQQWGLVNLDDASAVLAHALGPMIEDLAQTTENSLGLGNLIESVQMVVEGYAGAIVAGNGLTIPAGSSGLGSYIQAVWELNTTALAGDRILLRLSFPQSENYSRTVTPVLNIQLANGSTISRTAEVQTFSRQSHLTVEYDYILQGDEIAMKPYISLRSDDLVAANETIELTAFRPYYLNTPSSDETAADRAFNARAARVVDSTLPTLFGVGNVLSGEKISIQVFDGAVKDNKFTVRVPAGNVGELSLIQPTWNIESQAGKRVKLKLGFSTTDTFTRALKNPAMQVKTFDGPQGRPADTYKVSVLPQRVVVEIEYTLQGDEISLSPYIQLAATAAAEVDEFIRLEEFIPYYLNSSSDILTPLDEVLEERLAGGLAKMVSSKAQAYANIPAGIYDERKTIAVSGGDYNSPSNAVENILDASAAKRYQLEVKEGIYKDPEWFDTDFIDFKGTKKDQCIIDFQQPNDASEEDIAQYSAIYMNQNSRLEGLTVQVRNARYGIHLESNGQYPNKQQSIVNCHIEHLGNDDAVNNAWQSQNGIGSGLSSGQVVDVIGNTIISKNGQTFAYHTNAWFSDPTVVRIYNNRLVAKPTANVIGIRCLGSFQPDRCEIVGNTLTGNISYASYAWQPSELKGQPANHAEVEIVGHGNSPAVFLNLDWGEALCVESSNQSAGSSVFIAGDAVALIFGDGTEDKYFEREGSAGFGARIWGWGDVSGHAVGSSQDVYITSLGQRLGDCTISTKTLTVTVDGGSAINIVFNQDYTNTSNADILSFIGAALTGQATVTTIQPGARYRPHFSDEEGSFWNNSGTGIPFGSCVAYDMSKHEIRLMTSEDDVGLFAGVAWEDIPTGKTGRVKIRGFLPLSDIILNGQSSLTFGDSLSIDPANDGQVVVNGAQGVLRAIRSDAVEILSKHL